MVVVSKAKRTDRIKKPRKVVRNIENGDPANELQVQGRKIKVTNLDKVLYPSVVFTKGQVIDYYIRIAPYILPHLKNRPLTLKRYPNGVESEFFFEKHCSIHRPEWVETAAVYSKTRKADIDFCMSNNLPSLVWLANMASIELHTSLAVSRNVACPTMMVFDLDPGLPANLIQCAQVGLWIRGLFEELGLKVFPKTSGSKGLQLYVPLNTPVAYDETGSFAKSVAETLEKRHPEMVVSKMSKELRQGKVFVDWSQNDDHKTTVCVYSLRAKERPTVSTPVTWEEVESAMRSRKLGDMVFTSDDVLKRVERFGDLFAPVLKLKQKLPKIRTSGDLG